MRSTSLPKPVVVAALACMVLSGCGTLNAATDQTPAGSAVSATTPPGAKASDKDPEMRFLELTTRITQSCAPDAPKGSGGAPGPEDLPGWEESPTPRYGPGETPPGVPTADGDIPIPLDDPAPSRPTPDSTGPKPVKEVPLTGIETCSGIEHAKHVSEAFKNTKTTGYQAMHKKLTDLDYPAPRIHQIPNHAGAPRARLDLRVMGSHLALEVTGTSSGVTVEAFGAPETEDVKVTDVKRKPKLDAPAS
ncbi:hypothetical protein [Streptomyces sp. NPDC018833]|uniref:hypothetical protein n=1 Tax=Streptomyces sp. NPDC018833 TaxID=3365053 RepID=UPI00378A6AF9